MSNSTSRPCCERRLDGRARRAIVVARTPRPTRAARRLAHALERRLVDEMVVAAVDLAGPRLARRHRDRHARSPARLRSRRRGERRLAGARGRRQHQQQAAPGDAWARCRMRRSLDVLHLLAHLIDDGLSARPARVISVSLALEHSVLASRLNSWARKSSLRPTGSWTASSSRAAAIGRARRFNSSSMSARWRAAPPPDAGASDRALAPVHQARRSAPSGAADRLRRARGRGLDHRHQALDRRRAGSQMTAVEPRAFRGARLHRAPERLLQACQHARRAALPSRPRSPRARRPRARP